LRHVNCNINHAIPNVVIHMDLQNLDQNQLKTLFLNVNAQYLKTIDLPIAAYIDSPEFLKLRRELHDIMDELDKRRSMDPPLIHESSPHGLEPDALFDNPVFIADSE
jgi:hypothetical protein